MTALVLTSRIYARAPEIWPKSLSLQGESICFALFGSILRLASLLCLGSCATCGSLKLSPHLWAWWQDMKDVVCTVFRDRTCRTWMTWHDSIHGNNSNFRTLLSNFTWLYGNNFFQLWLVADFPYYIFLLWFPPLANSSTSFISAAFTWQVSGAWWGHGSPLLLVLVWGLLFPFLFLAGLCWWGCSILVLVWGLLSGRSLHTCGSMAPLATFTCMGLAFSFPFSDRAGGLALVKGWQTAPYNSCPCVEGAWVLGCSWGTRLLLLLLLVQ